MSRYKSRIPLEPAYALALGQASYNFLHLEWGIVWCAERLQPGYIHTVKTKTAGQIASDFIQAVDGTSIRDGSTANELKALASQFKTLVGRRNDLVHSTPHTAEGGEQRLGRTTQAGKSISWSIDEIDAVALEFETCAIEANRLLHGPLANLA